MKSNRFTATVLALFLLPLSLSAATPAEREAARAELVKGVATVDIGGGAIPGAMLCASGDAFPVAHCRNHDDTASFVAAASLFGEGRAVYLGHPGYLDHGSLQGDSALFLKNALRWLARGKDAPKVAVWREKTVADTVRKLGIEPTVIDSAEAFPGYDVVVARNFTMDTADAFTEFVRRGGGLLAAGLGWGWKFYRPTDSLATEFADNRVFGPMGILMTGASCKHAKGSTFPTASNVPRAAFAEAALDLAISGNYASKEERKQVATILSQLVDTLPPGVLPGLHAKFAELSARPEAAKVPAPGSPIGPEDVLARISTIARQTAWKSDPLKVWPADPAAVHYPGLVKEGTPVITRTVPVDGSIPRWHSTGLFLAAGAPLTVTLPEGAEKLGLKLRIGTTADDLTYARDTWERAPNVTLSVPLDRRETTLGTPFGGLVYIDVPDSGDVRGKVFDVTLAGAVMAPWFKLGRDTNGDFLRECAETGAPQGEIEGRAFVVTVETLSLQRVDDPQWIAEYWDRVLDADQELACWKERRSPERICSDLELTAGWLHNGYPLMFHIDRKKHFDGVVDKESLARGEGWGYYHEIGHNHQNRDWTPDGAGEVTVNLFSCYAIEAVCGQDCREDRFLSGRRQQNLRVSRWATKGPTFEEWKKDPFLALEMYLRIKEAFGWDLYKTVFARYLEPGFRHPANNAEKWDVFAVEMSKAANANLGAAMAAWTIPLSDKALAECAAFPPAPPSITRGIVEEPYVPPAAEPVEGLYMGVSLAGEDAGAIELYATREDIPGGEGDRRWKTDRLLLRRIDPTDGAFALGRRGTGPESWEAEHSVEITKPYYFGVYELTQEQWFHVMGAWRRGCIGAEGDRETRPVNGVSYEETRGATGVGINWPKTGHAVDPDSFFGRLRELTGVRAEFDMPTEAQWEYAARALTTGKWNSGEDPQPYNIGACSADHVLDRLGRYCANGGEPEAGGAVPAETATESGTAPVGSYRPNAWGIYDTHGNVCEHCLDWWWPLGKASGVTGRDPVGPDRPEHEPRRVLRGGCWWDFSFGGADKAANWSRGLGNLCDPGIGHVAAGIRVCVPAAVAPSAASPEKK